MAASSSVSSVMTNRVTAAAFSSDGRLVVTGSLDGTAKIWSLPDGRPILTLRGHAGPLTEVAFSQDTQFIVTASRDRTARIWRVKDGTEQVTLEGHDAPLSSAAFSPNGMYIVTTSAADHTVRLWDTASGREVTELTGKSGSSSGHPLPTSAVFNSDGTRIALVSGEKSARIVRVFLNPSDLIDHAHSLVPRSLTPCERKRFFLPVDEGGIGDCVN